MDDPDRIIALRNISFGYPGDKLVLDGLNMDVRRGDRMGLLGPNGSGKTTLFHIIMGLLKPSGGSIEIFGNPVTGEKDFRNVRSRIGFLFQDADDQLFSPTVLEDVAFGPLNLGKSKTEAKTIALETLNSLGLSGFEHRITYKLSGGEKRLVSLATVLAMKPEVLLLDEPSTGLDEATEIRLVEILKSLDISYILVSHNLDFLVKITNCVGWLVEGKFTVDEESVPHTHVHLHGHGKYTHQHSFTRRDSVEYPDIEQKRSAESESSHDFLSSGEAPNSETSGGQKGSTMNFVEKAKIRLEHWIDHNDHHIQDYEAFVKQLEEAGKTESAEYIRAMMKLTEESTECLRKAVKALN